MFYLKLRCTCSANNVISLCHLFTYGKKTSLKGAVNVYLGYNRGTKEFFTFNLMVYRVRFQLKGGFAGCNKSLVLMDTIKDTLEAVMNQRHQACRKHVVASIERNSIWIADGCYVFPYGNMLLFGNCLEIKHLLVYDIDICITHILKYIPVIKAVP